MVDSKKDKFKKSELDFERLSAYAETLNKKYSQADDQDYDFAGVLSTQKPELYLTKENSVGPKDFELDDIDYSKKENEDEEDIELFDDSSNLTGRFASLKQKKYLLALIPLLFLVLFLLMGERAHTGTIKTGGFTYVGQIVNDTPSGKGVMTYQNGDSYNGNFVAGKFSGLGTFVSKSGNWTFIGIFKDGLADGKGTLTTPDGVKHVETYKNGVMAR